MLAGACNLQLILLRRGDLLGYGGAASSSLLSSEGKSSSVGVSVSSSSWSCVFGMGLLLFLPTVLGRRAPSKHMRHCRSIVCASASDVACSRRSLLSVLCDILFAAVVCCFVFIRWRFWACSSKIC